MSTFEKFLDKTDVLLDLKSMAAIKGGGDPPPWQDDDDDWDDEDE